MKRANIEKTVERPAKTSKQNEEKKKDSLRYSTTLLGKAGALASAYQEVIDLSQVQRLKKSEKDGVWSVLMFMGGSEFRMVCYDKTQAFMICQMWYFTRISKKPIILRVDESNHMQIDLL